MDLTSSGPLDSPSLRRLLGSLRIALDPRKLLLSAIGVGLMAIGWRLIVAVFPIESADGVVVDMEDEPVAVVGDADRETIEYLRRLPWFQDPDGDAFRSPLKPGGWSRVGLPRSLQLVFEPIQRLTFPVALMVKRRQLTGLGIALTVWTLAVWSIFGGAITRIAAVEIATGSRPSLTAGLQFALRKFGTYFGAPLLPCAGVVMIVLLCCVGSLLTWVPVLDVIVGFLWILMLLAGLVMAVALLVLPMAWPLMHAAISAENAEVFEAFSRGYSYVVGQPWKYFTYAVIGLLHGAIACVIAVVVADATLHLSQFAVSWCNPTDARLLYCLAPTVGGWRADLGPVDGAPPTGTLFGAALGVSVWTHFLFLVLIGFVYSYFWTTSTVIYFLLRRANDGADLTEVYTPPLPEEPFPTIFPPPAG